MHFHVLCPKVILALGMSHNIYTAPYLLHQSSHRQASSKWHSGGIWIRINWIRTPGHKPFRFACPEQDPDDHPAFQIDPLNTSNK